MLLFLPTALACETGPKTVIAKSFSLGLVFAFFCYLAQENLAAGVLSALMLLSVGWLTQAYTTERLARVALGLGLGFMVFCVPLLGFYAYHGQLSKFLDLYFLSTNLFAHGYANTAYVGGLQDPWGKTYYFMPGLMVALGGLALYRPRMSGLEAGWSRERLLIIAMAIFCLLAHTGAMFRADSTHLKNTMIGLAVLAPCSVAYLPELIGPLKAATRWSLRILIVAVLVGLLPRGLWREAFSNFQAVTKARKLYWLKRFDTANPQVAGTAEAFRRVGTGLIDEPHYCDGHSASMRNMTEFMVELKNITAERGTYVQNIPGLPPGLVYFFADLIPAPIYAERADMIVNSRLLNEFLKHFKNDSENIQCIVAGSKESPEIEIFKLAHPNYRVVQKEFESRPIYIFLADTTVHQPKSYEQKPNPTK